jgi:hypothetical protein
MPDKADIAAIILTLSSYAVTMVYAFSVPGAITQNGPSFPTYLILTVPIFTFAAYWAFDVRRALAVRIYRSQALGVGMLILAFWTTIAAFVLTPTNPSSFLPSLVQILAFSFLFIVLFYWIDASIRTARRSDPLLRDTFYWGKLRIVIWIGLIVSTVVPIAALLYVGFTANPSLTNQLNAGTFGGPVFSFILNNFLFNFPLAVPVVGIIYIPAIAVRAKWNRNLRNHFIWFAPVAAAVLLIFFGPIAGAPIDIVSLLVTGPLVVVTGYSLFRSAKALVSLNRISTSITQK